MKKKVLLGAVAALILAGTATSCSAAGKSIVGTPNGKWYYAESSQYYYVNRVKIEGDILTIEIQLAPYEGLEKYVYFLEKDEDNVVHWSYPYYVGQKVIYKDGKVYINKYHVDYNDVPTEYKPR